MKWMALLITVLVLFVATAPVSAQCPCSVGGPCVCGPNGCYCPYVGVRPLPVGIAYAPTSTVITSTRVTPFTMTYTTMTIAPTLPAAPTLAPAPVYAYAPAVAYAPARGTVSLLPARGGCPNGRCPR